MAGASVKASFAFREAHQFWRDVRSDIAGKLRAAAGQKEVALKQQLEVSESMVAMIEGKHLDDRFE